MSALYISRFTCDECGKEESTMTDAFVAVPDAPLQVWGWARIEIPERLDFCPDCVEYLRIGGHLL